MRNRILRHFALVLFFCRAPWFLGLAWGGETRGDVPLTPPVRAKVINAILEQLNQNYVSPEIARKIERDIRERLGKKEYDGISSGGEFARTLTAQLLEVSRDKHLGVSYSPTELPKRIRSEPTADEKKTRDRRAAAANFGLKKLERLDGNIGYLELEWFWRPNEAGDTIASAMTFLSHTDALIIDLRSNGGGNPGTVALLCSYLLGEEPVHLWDQYSRPENTTRQTWTLPFVSGKKYLSREVYILTSKETFSAAEGFAYTLKNLKRATIIGQTTAGGAHPGDAKAIDDHFTLFVPTGRIISPVTKTDWEGMGVKPDQDVPVDLALPTAQLSALKEIIAKGMRDPELLEQVKKKSERLEQELKR
jgi:C-terminal processing protease CtpA/Prc